jgi:hypothetical protein
LWTLISHHIMSDRHSSQDKRQVRFVPEYRRWTDRPIAICSLRCSHQRTLRLAGSWYWISLAMFFSSSLTACYIALRSRKSLNRQPLLFPRSYRVFPRHSLLRDVQTKRDFAPNGLTNHKTPHDMQSHSRCVENDSTLQRTATT